MDTRKKISKSQQGQYAKPMEAEHFVNKHGADIVRLWVASVNFADEVPFGEEMFARLSETYRRLRNTLRILLGNLADFDPAHPAPEETLDLRGPLDHAPAPGSHRCLPRGLRRLRVPQGLPRASTSSAPWT